MIPDAVFENKNRRSYIRLAVTKEAVRAEPEGRGHIAFISRADGTGIPEPAPEDHTNKRFKMGFKYFNSFIYVIICNQAGMSEKNRTDRFRQPGSYRTFRAEHQKKCSEEVRDLYRIGDIPMPPGFRYKEIFLRGKPRHDKTDAFRIRHPSMDAGRRAKIFAPFDALKGFDEAVAAKDELYEDRREQSEEDLAELNRRLTILRQLTANSRRTGEPAVRISVTYYIPCTDPESEACGLRGQYHTVTGICRKVDPDVSRSLLLDQTKIRFRDIFRIESDDGIFEDRRQCSFP